MSTTVHHPTIKGVAQDVPDADVKRWQKSGWVVADEAGDTGNSTGPHVHIEPSDDNPKRKKGHDSDES